MTKHGCDTCRFARWVNDVIGCGVCIWKKDIPLCLHNNQQHIYFIDNKPINMLMQVIEECPVWEEVQPLCVPECLSL